MARRAGKATNRKARQRKVQRPAGAAPTSAAQAPATQRAVESVADPVTPVVAPARTSVVASSRLTASERSEYHYVERDLRDIGILTAVMAALLLAAWFAFRAMGLLS